MPTITTQCRVISRPTQHRLITQRHEPHTLLTSSTSIDQERDHRIDLALYGPLIDGESLDVQFAVGHAGRWTGMILTVEDSGTGGGAAFRLDVEKNGTSIFSADADKPTVPAGSGTTQTDQTVQADIFVQTFAATDVFHVVIDQVAASAEHATLTLFYQETEGILPTTHHRVDFSYYGGLVVGENMGPACAIGHAGILTGVLFSIEDSGAALGDDAVVDVLLGGSSVFATLANKPTIVAGFATTQVDQTPAADINTVAFGATGVFTLPILSAAAGAQHAKLTLFYNEI